MTASDRLGAISAIPGLLLAITIFGYLIFSHVACEPLYEPNRLLDFEFLMVANDNIAAELGGPIEPPPRPDLRLNPSLVFPSSCY